MGSRKAFEQKTIRLPPEILERYKEYPGGLAKFIRESIYHYRSARHYFKFRDILNDIAGEMLLLTKWKEKGHPEGAEWTEKEEQMLEYYERCFSILENSPFNDDIEKGVF